MVCIRLSKVSLVLCGKEQSEDKILTVQKMSLVYSSEEIIFFNIKGVVLLFCFAGGSGLLVLSFSDNSKFQYMSF